MGVCQSSNQVTALRRHSSTGCAAAAPKFKLSAVVPVQCSVPPTQPLAAFARATATTSATASTPASVSASASHHADDSSAENTMTSVLEAAMASCVSPYTTAPDRPLPSSTTAATAIQSVWRGHLGRRTADTERAQVAAGFNHAFDDWDGVDDWEDLWEPVPLASHDGVQANTTPTTTTTTQTPPASEPTLHLKQCVHKCLLVFTVDCCSCSDSRANAHALQGYVDGVGVVANAYKRTHGYCTVCVLRCEETVSTTENNNKKKKKKKQAGSPVVASVGPPGGEPNFIQC